MSEKKLTQLKCEPCEGGIPPMKEARAQEHLKSLHDDWKLSSHATSLYREMTFKDFSANIAFVNKIAILAESEGHHPDLNIHGWNKLRITLSTHAIKGLSMNDFILAAKIDQL